MRGLVCRVMNDQSAMLSGMPFWHFVGVCNYQISCAQTVAVKQ
ncbi:hypothetical protein [Amphritea japonica]|nr:hypothetical protein [Amphritea japonica]